jgi:N-acetylneuraminic acid mutarotase
MILPLSHANIARAQTCQPIVTVDTPADNATVRQTAALSGWAVDLAEPADVGVTAIHVYLDGEAGVGTLLGAATNGLARPDIARAYGQPRERSGWTFTADLSAVPVGGHALYIYAQTRCGWTWARQGINLAAADGWALLNPPPARNSHAAVWDTTNSQMLAVGGRGSASLADLWSYRPTTDTWMPLVGPGVALLGHTAVWDPIDAQMLVYGGLGGPKESSGLWSYRPATKIWTELRPEGSAPTIRAYHAAAWDSASNRMLIFGGLGGGFDAFNDVWGYDPASNAWTQLADNYFFTFGLVPDGRFYSSAVWDPNGAQLLVFAGANPQYGLLDDLWSFDPASGEWTELEADGPLPEARLSQSAVWDPNRSEMLVFAGGCGGCYLSDFWSYNPAQNTWTQLSSGAGSPQARGGHSAVWDSTHGEMLVFGGSSLNDLWAYRPGQATWAQRVSREPPAPATAGHRAVWDEAGSQMLVFGGRSGRDSVSSLNTVWSYGLTSNLWKPISTSGAAPSARLGHSVVWDPAARRALLFGGSGGDGKGLADLWAYDLATNTWAELKPEGAAPPARAVHSAVWDATGGQMLIFGGAPNTSSAFDDLWSYTPATNRWTELKPAGVAPSPRSRHSAVWDPASRQMIVFGGYSTSDLTNSTGAYTNELWSYSAAANTWSKLNAPGTQPPARARHSATWDPDDGQMLVYGGYVGGVDYLADLWSYRPATNQWMQLTGDGAAPRPRSDQSAIWDSAGAGLLMYGGSGGDLTSELWSYRPPALLRPTAPPAPSV